MVLSASFVNMHRQVKNLESPEICDPAEVKRDEVGPSWINSHSKCVLSVVYLVSHFFPPFVLKEISLSEISPKHRAGMLSGVPMYKKVVMFLTKKITCVRKDTFSHELRYHWLWVQSAVSPQYILNKVSSNRNKLMYWLVDENIVTRGLEEPNPVFPLRAMIQ